MTVEGQKLLVLSDLYIHINTMPSLWQNELILNWTNVYDPIKLYSYWYLDRA